MTVTEAKELLNNPAEAAKHPAKALEAIRILGGLVGAVPPGDDE